MSTDNLAKARAAKARKADAKAKAEIKRARAWIRAMREEAKWRGIYMETFEPREKERARKSWLHARDAWAKIGRAPTDKYFAIAKELDRSDR